MRLIRFLFSLYPRSFRDRVGDSMLQTLADSSMEAGPLRTISLHADLAFGAVYENLRSISDRELLTPVFAAGLGALMIAPGILMLTMLVLGIEPPLGPLRPYLTAPPDVPNINGSLAALTIIVVLPLAGLILNYSVIRRSVLVEGGRTILRANLLVALLGVCIVLAFLALIVIDQYPCWIGMPNCD